MNLFQGIIDQTLNKQTNERLKYISLSNLELRTFYLIQNIECFKDVRKFCSTQVTEASAGCLHVM